MPINKEKKKPVGLSLDLDTYEKFHKYAIEEERSDAYLAQKIFKLGLAEYEKNRKK